MMFPSERRKRLRPFKWSSYRGYAGPGAAVSVRAERLRYRRFVEEGVEREIENPFEAVKWEAVLGDESFLQKLRDRVKDLHKQRREITALRKVRRTIAVEEILDRVVKAQKLDCKRLLARDQWGLAAKNIAMWMIWESGKKSPREIGELFGWLGLCRCGAADSPSSLRSACQCGSQTDESNIKCLGLTLPRAPKLTRTMPN